MNLWKSIGVLAGLSLLFGIVALTSTISDIKNYDRSAQSFTHEATYNLESGSTIMVDFETDRVEFYATTGDAIEVYYEKELYRQKVIDVMDDYFKVTHESNRLVLKQKQWNENIFTSDWLARLIDGNFNQAGLLKVGVPNGQDYQIMVKMSAGQVIMADIEVANIDVAVSAGQARLSDSRAETLKASVGAGQIQISNLTVLQEVDLNAASGQVHVTGLSAPIVDAKVSTGSLHLSDLKALETLKAHASTGSIRVFMDESESFEVFANMSTGNFTSDFDMAISKNISGYDRYGVHEGIGGGPLAEIYLSTHTGSVSVNRIK